MVSCGMRKICEVFSKEKKREKEKKTPTVIRIFREFLGISRSVVFCIVFVRPHVYDESI